MAAVSNMGSMGVMGPMMRSMRADRAVLSHKITRQTLFRVFGFGRNQRGLIATFIGLTIIDAGLVVVNPLLAQRLIDHGILGHNTELVVWIAVAMAGVAILDSTLAVTSGFISARIGENVIYELRTQVFAHVQTMSLAFFTRTQTGKLVSRLNNDVIGAQTAFTSTLSSTVSNVISVLIVGGTMLTLSWQVTLICVVLVPILFAASRIVGRLVSGLRREQMDGNADLGSMMTERFSVSGALLLKLFGRRADENAKYAEKADRVRAAGIKIALVSRSFMALMLLIPALATAIVYGVAGTLVINHVLTLGTLTALATLLLRLIGPLQGLANVRVDVMTALVSFDRVFEVLDLPSMVQEKPDAVTLPASAARLEFDNVGFTYPRADEVSLASLESVARQESREYEPVLRGISFTAEPGQLVALVGPSGAGKTTMTHLVARLYDVETGAVRVGGQDVRDVTLPSLEDVVGYVTQDAHMFHDTIREYLLYARSTATEDEMWAAVDAAQVGDIVRGMPDGLDTVVGDRGYRLSGGERQRLAIARLLLKAPAIVVLDEATAHLDSESEVAVQRALDTALEGRTALVIAHRLSTIRGADQILVLDGGQVVERGTHSELLAREGLYAELYRTQFLEGVRVDA